MTTKISNIEPIKHYQISQHLQEKQLEILERKYGGHLRCRRAATIIQRSFRRYKLKENFRHLCATVKVNKRLSCSLIDSSRIDQLKPCLKSIKNINDQSQIDSTSIENYKSVSLDLPSIHFGHFIETNRQKRNNQRKRVFIVTEENLEKKSNESIDTLSDFVDKHSLATLENPLAIEQYDSNENQQTISSSSKPIPPIRTLSLTARTVLTTNLSSISESNKTSLSVSSPINDIKELADLLTNHLNPEKASMISPTSTISSDRDSFSIQSTSSESNTSSTSNRTSLNSVDSTKRSSLIIDDRPTILQGFDRLKRIQNDEIYRRRCYRVGLNLFNKKPQQGIRYLILNCFIENDAQAVGRFLLSRKGLSRQKIGEYLGNLQDSFAMKVLKAFVNEFDFHQMPIDVALRKFQASFRLPGEAQKIEQLMKVFSQRFCENNVGTSSAGNVDTIFILAFAIIMLNTDLHSRNIKTERKMRLEEFIKNLRAIDDGENLDVKYLTSIYERIRTNEFRSDPDHVTQVVQFEQILIGKKANLSAPHRRLVCYCRFYEVYDVNKRDKFASHQREVYLFNDLLVITKLAGKKHQQFRQTIRLSSMNFYLFETTYYRYGVRLVRRLNENEITLITFNARNEHDRRKFCEDLEETILELNEFEALNVRSEFDQVRSSTTTIVENHQTNVLSSLIDFPTVKRDRISRTLSNSLLDMNLPINNHQIVSYRTSQCSLDSGMISLSNEFTANNRILMH